MNEENVENKPSEVEEPTGNEAPVKVDEEGVHVYPPEEPTVPTEVEAPQPSAQPPATESQDTSKPLPIFRLKLKAKVLEAIFTAIVSLVEEATFTVTAAGVNLKALCSDRVAMVVFDYPKEAFEEFSVDREGQLAFNLKEALKVLRRAGKDETTELIVTNESKMLPLTLKLHGKYERFFNLPALLPEVEEIPTPKLSPDTHIKLAVESLAGMVEDATLVSDHVKILAQPEILQFLAEGDSTSVDIKLVKGLHPQLLELELRDIAKPTKAVFSLTYLQAIAKGIRDLADVAALDYSTDMPIQITAQTDKGSMTYYVAPRIEEL